jgi:hypothetical protein
MSKRLAKEVLKETRNERVVSADEDAVVNVDG